LLAAINNATPADFAYEGYYFDGPNKISFGNKNG